VLPATDADAAWATAERLRAAITDHDWPLGRVTASFGIATTTRDVLAAADLIDAADRALYLSKRLGRDRVTHRDKMGEILRTDNIVHAVAVATAGRSGAATALPILRRS
jgi:predicted signal transduction protein with EAL and GGDEF domain